MLTRQDQHFRSKVAQTMELLQGAQEWAGHTAQHGQLHRETHGQLEDVDLGNRP